MYEVYSKIFKVKKVRIGYDINYNINYKQFDKFLKSKPRILFFPNPNQPIESSINLKDMSRLAKKCKSKRLYFSIRRSLLSFWISNWYEYFKKI